MTTNYIGATNTIYGLFAADFKAAATAIAGDPVGIRYWGVSSDQDPANTSYWCRVSLQTVRESQSAHPGSASDLKRRYRSEGLVFIQIMCPISKEDAPLKGRLLADMTKKILRGKNIGSVVFENTRIQEMPPESGALVFRVVSEYNYDEIG